MMTYLPIDTVPVYPATHLCVEWKLVELHVLEERPVDATSFGDCRLARRVERYGVPDVLLRIAESVVYGQPRVPVQLPVYIFGRLDTNDYNPELYQ